MESSKNLKNKNLVLEFEFAKSAKENVYDHQIDISKTEKQRSHKNFIR